MARNTIAMHRGHLVSRVADACAHTVSLPYPTAIPAFTTEWSNGTGNLGSQEKREQRVAVT